ncbi:hypothetical protein EBR21_08295, partial [bacterium]|nr:hypothetical protein [bacterium]
WRPNGRQPDICIIDALGEASIHDARLLAGLKKLQFAAPDRKISLATTPDNVSRLEKDVPDAIEILALPPCPSNPEVLSRARGIQQFWNSQQFQTWLGRPAQSVFIEGGAKLLSSMLEINALDVMHVFVAPMLLAGEARRLSREENPAPKLSSAAHFDVLSTFALGNDMLIELAAQPLVKEFFSEG